MNEPSVEKRGLSGQDQDIPLSELITDIVEAIVRRRWWILLSASSVIFGTVAYSLRLPNRYQSEAVVGIVQQAVSQRYVVPDAIPVQDAVSSMTREILSRTSVRQIIDEFDLYPNVRSELPSEELAKIFAKDCEIEPIIVGHTETPTALRVTFTSASPKVAQKVVNRIISLFIEENDKMRGGQVASTTSFLAENVEAARLKLTEQDLKLREFKSRNAGQLPEQQISNLQILNDLRSQLQNVTVDLERIQRQRRSLENTITDELNRRRLAREALLKVVTSRHPTALDRDLEIATLEALLQLVRTGSNADDQQQLVAISADLFVIQTRGQAEVVTADRARQSATEAQIQAKLKEYELRLSLAPILEQELTQLTRDYDLLREDYSGLKAKQLQSELGAQLEQRHEGQRFRPIDTATLPIKPSSPNRLKICLIGTVGGLVLGLFLAIARDKTDTSFRSEKRLREAFRTPVVLGIPEILTASERSARRRKQVFEWASSSLLLVCVAFAELYVVIHP